jgi:hypothetical protein
MGPKIQFNGVGGLRTHIRFARIGAQPSRVALLQAGVSRDDVKIAIIRKRLPAEDHAVVVSRVDGQWLILDNLRLALVRDTEMIGFIPKFVLDEGGHGASSRQAELGMGG